MNGIYRIPTAEAARIIMNHYHGVDNKLLEIDAKLGQGEILIHWTDDGVFDEGDEE